MVGVNQWNNNVVPFILEQYSGTVTRDGQGGQLNNWQSILKATVDQLQVIDDDGLELSEILKVDESDPPTGRRLEYLSSLVGVKRSAGESDASLFARFAETCEAFRDGTPDHIITQARFITGDASPVYHEEKDVPASFIMYTPGSVDGKIMTRDELRKISPAGVRGLPGAAIVAQDGRFIVAQDGSRIIGIGRLKR